jgi:hypothetical protein
MHNLLDRPSDRPVRTAAGVADARAVLGHALHRQLDRRARQLLQRLAQQVLVAMRS